jgi:hypothetical protein
MVDAVETKPVLLRYRNRDIRVDDVEFLRGAVTRWGELGRTALARQVCAAWGWQQRNGASSVQACQDLMLRLQERGYIELPPARRGRGVRRSLPLLPADLIALSWTEVSEADVDLDDLEVRPIAREERLGWRLFMDRYHPLGCRPIVGEHILYAAFVGRELLALLGWAAAAFRIGVREEYIGWDEETKRRRLHLVANNVRFLVPRWVRVKNLASKVLAYNLRRLSDDWQRQWGHPVHLAETFVDTARHRGTCYRAANWRLLGQSAGRRKRGNAYLHDSTPKAVFVYELVHNARQILRHGDAP